MAQTAKLAKALQPGLSEVSTAHGQLQASDPGHWPLLATAEPGKYIP